jgi:hypothetical protein
MIPPSPRLRPFWYYFGGKWRAAPKYPPPRYKTIVEPFAGAAGYSMLWHDRDIVLCDKDPTIAGLWRWLISADSEEILALPDLLPGQKVRDLGLHPAAAALMGFWCNNGVTTPRQSNSKWSRALGKNGWCRERGRFIAAQLPYIRHWRVVDGDYSTLPNNEATWMVDPPYQVMGSFYKYGAKAIDFASLGDWCATRQGQVIVCENAGARWLPFRDFATFRAVRRPGRTTRSVEVVWTRDKAEQLSLPGGAK